MTANGDTNVCQVAQPCVDHPPKEEGCGRAERRLVIWASQGSARLVLGQAPGTSKQKTMRVHDFVPGN
jgi:hypothetical protein